jgi:hypothetical protein
MAERIMSNIYSPYRFADLERWKELSEALPSDLTANARDKLWELFLQELFKHPGDLGTYDQEVETVAYTEEAIAAI